MTSVIEIRKLKKKIDILTSAKKLFMEKGFENTSLEEISHSVGIAKGSIYSYFEDKKDLLASILVEELDKLINYINANKIYSVNVIEGYINLNLDIDKLFIYLPQLLSHRVLSQEIGKLEETLLIAGKDSHECLEQIIGKLVMCSVTS